MKMVIFKKKIKFIFADCLKFKTISMCRFYNKMILQVFPHEKLVNNGKKFLETKMIVKFKFYN
jgi:hypothetical protein